MLEGLLPAGVAVAATRGDLSVRLFPSEELVVRNAVARRRREFTTGRALARRALGEIGVAAGAIPPEPDGSPRWPGGTVGSITHCAGYRACAAARRDTVASLGIDAEPNGPISPSVARLIASPRESRWLERLAVAYPRVEWPRLLFSAKESIYKAWWPLTGEPLGFGDAEVRFEPGAGTFRALLLASVGAPGEDALSVLEGRWREREGVLLTAVSVSPGAPF